LCIKVLSLYLFYQTIGFDFILTIMFFGIGLELENVKSNEEIKKELMWNIKEYLKLIRWRKRGNYVEGVDEVIQDHLDEINYLINLE
jgi:hypothetical protein